MIKAFVLSSASNVVMTFAWYAHLKDLKGKPWFVAALISWGIAFFEYVLQVSANRFGSETLSLPQLKIIQEVITLTVFVPFVFFYIMQPLKWDYLWAAGCMCGTVYFIFRKLLGKAPRQQELGHQVGTRNERIRCERMIDTGRVGWYSSIPLFQSSSIPPSHEAPPLSYRRRPRRLRDHRFAVLQTCGLRP